MQRLSSVKFYGILWVLLVNNVINLHNSNSKSLNRVEVRAGLRPILKFDQVPAKWPIEFGKFTVNIGLNCGFVKFTGGERATAQCGHKARIYNRQSFDGDGSNFYFSPRLLMIARGQGVNFGNQSRVITLITPTTNICSNTFKDWIIVSWPISGRNPSVCTQIFLGLYTTVERARHYQWNKTIKHRRNIHMGFR